MTTHAWFTMHRFSFNRAMCCLNIKGRASPGAFMTGYDGHIGDSITLDKPRNDAFFLNCHCRRRVLEWIMKVKVVHSHGPITAT
jgi:hypothetical protein